MCAKHPSRICALSLKIHPSDAVTGWRAPHARIAPPRPIRSMSCVALRPPAPDNIISPAPPLIDRDCPLQHSAPRLTLTTPYLRQTYQSAYILAKIRCSTLPPPPPPFCSAPPPHSSSPQCFTRLPSSNGSSGNATSTKLPSRCTC